MCRRSFIFWHQQTHAIVLKTVICQRSSVMRSQSAHHLHDNCHYINHSFKLMSMTSLVACNTVKQLRQTAHFVSKQLLLSASLQLNNIDAIHAIGLIICWEVKASYIVDLKMTVRISAWASCIVVFTSCIIMIIVRLHYAALCYIIVDTVVQMRTKFTWSVSS